MKIFVVLISFFTSLNVYAQKGNHYQSSWDNNNGKEVNISPEKFLCLKKPGICYFISNNKDNLIICIRTGDVTVQSRILIEGMTLWIDMNGKQEKGMGVRFPIGSRRSSGADGNLLTAITNANAIELTGFSGESEKRFPSENADSFNGYVKFDNDGALLYRMIMPLAKLPLRNARASNGAMPFNIGIEYGGGKDTESKKPPVSIWVKDISLATGR